MLKYTIVLLGGMFAFMALAPEPEGRIFGDKTVVSKVEPVSAPIITTKPQSVEPVQAIVQPVAAPVVAAKEQPRAYVAPVSGVIQIGATVAPTVTPLAQDGEQQEQFLTAAVLNPRPVPRPDQNSLTTAALSETDPYYPIWFVTGRSVNVRQGPSTDFDVLGNVVYGEAAEIIADSGGNWVKIRIEGDGVEGFIARRFMSETEPAQ